MGKSTLLGPHKEARCLRARRAFEAWRSPFEVMERESEIAALPRVEWKGQVLYTLRCHGERGNGPHDTNVQEAVLWALIDLRAYRCPYHG